MKEVHNSYVTYPLLLLPILCGSCSAVLLFDYGFIHGDEGVALMGGWMIFLGDLPHRDFFEIFPPFSFLITALFFKVLGASFFSERLLVVVYALSLIVAGDRLLIHFTRNLIACGLVAAFLIPYGVFHWPLQSHHWVVDIVQILALTCLINGMHRSSFLWGGLAGLWTFLGCFSMQDQGGYLVIALLLLFFPIIKESSVRKKLLSGWLAGGGWWWFSLRRICCPTFR